MPLQRKKDWETAFEAFLLARANAPFAWGTNDCALFTADAIEAISGTDIAADFRGKYANDVDALTLVWKLTGKSDDKGRTAVANAAEYCAEKAGLVEYEHPLMAQRGDLVVMENRGALGVSSLIAGVVHLNGRHLISMAADGPVRLPITAIKRSWKV